MTQMTRMRNSHNSDFFHVFLIRINYFHIQMDNFILHLDFTIVCFMQQTSTYVYI